MSVPEAKWRKIPGLSPQPDCPEPFHAHVHDERAHRAHHWSERLQCMGLCVLLHLGLEYGPDLFRALAG